MKYGQKRESASELKMRNFFELPEVWLTLQNSQFIQRYISAHSVNENSEAKKTKTSHDFRLILFRIHENREPICRL